MNCFGKDKNAATAKTQSFMPHVEKTAVVTVGKRNRYQRNPRVH